MTSTSKSLTPVVSVFLFFIFLLLIWFTIGAFGFYDAVVSNFWPTTDGTVISTRVISPSGKANKYIAEITFTYAVGGEEYQSNNYKATSARGTSQWARELIEQHPVDSKVQVHYNPNKPEDAIVEPGLQSDNYYMTLLPLMFIIVLAVGLKQQIRNRNNSVENLVPDAQ